MVSVGRSRSRVRGSGCGAGVADGARGGCVDIWGSRLRSVARSGVTGAGGGVGVSLALVSRPDGR